MRSVTVPRKPEHYMESAANLRTMKATTETILIALVKQRRALELKLRRTADAVEAAKVVIGQIDIAERSEFAADIIDELQEAVNQLEKSLKKK
jgi:hypothetical protein